MLLLLLLLLYLYVCIGLGPDHRSDLTVRPFMLVLCVLMNAIGRRGFAGIVRESRLGHATSFALLYLSGQQNMNASKDIVYRWRRQ